MRFRGIAVHDLKAKQYIQIIQRKKMSGGQHNAFWCFWPHRKYENKKQEHTIYLWSDIKKEGGPQAQHSIREDPTILPEKSAITTSFLPVVGGFGTELQQSVLHVDCRVVSSEGSSGMVSKEKQSRTASLLVPSTHRLVLCCCWLFSVPFGITKRTE